MQNITILGVQVLSGWKFQRFGPFNGIMDMNFPTIYLSDKNYWIFEEYPQYLK